jgi:hypothetical protein
LDVSRREYTGVNGKRRSNWSFGVARQFILGVVARVGINYLSRRKAKGQLRRAGYGSGITAAPRST